jgi:CheY-like chemotaxis protein
MSSFLILVVDDDLEACDLAATILRSAGHLVLSAANATQAVTLLDRHPGVDLVVTDVVMPGIGGLMLADIARVRWPELKFAYVTGYGELPGIGSALRNDQVLHKPYRARDLEAVVMKSLRAAMPETVDSAAR